MNVLTRLIFLSFPGIHSTAYQGKVFQQGITVFYVTACNFGFLLKRKCWTNPTSENVKWASFEKKDVEINMVIK